MNAKSSARPAKTGAAPSHQRSRSGAASAIVISSQKQMNRNWAPSANQFSNAHSRYPALTTSYRFCHQRSATANGSWAIQTSASPIIPSSIPVPMRPAADSRMKRQPRQAKSASTASSTSCAAIPFQRRKRS